MPKLLLILYSSFIKTGLWENFTLALMGLSQERLERL
jgi:hypothetical protein